MQDLKKYFVLIIIAVWCFSFSHAQLSSQIETTDQEENTGQLITPVLAPELPTPPVAEEQSAEGPQTQQSSRSFLPQGLANIFQQKPKQPQQATAATSQQQTQSTQTTQSNTANLKEGFQPGNIATDFRLLNMEGQTVQLSSLRGRPVLLNFWGINCPPCIEELPILQKADREINGQYRGLSGSTNAHFILVALKSDSDETKEFLDELGINMNTLIEASLDQQSNLPYSVDDTESVFRDYRAFGLPTTFLIDHTGVIQSKRVGAFINEAELSHYLKSLNVNWQPVQY